ncbi:MAG: molybdopterin-dependent oxidoreductase [Acidimicrobiia bacterium]|nr:molybdopterin-dependent oxidoreductase [Acidimicrobiia bacterium]MDH4306071.1 molybdopterin-dependent oxidoreductase [Acidimicrobiia bacterium]
MQITEQSPEVERTPGPPAAAGALGVAAALAASELSAGLVDSVPSLVLGIATFVIDTVPKPIKDWAIATFGTADKLVLAVGIVVVALALGMAVGRAGKGVRAAVFGAFGLIAALAAARNPNTSVVAALANGAVSAAVGFAVTGWLKRPRAEADPSRRAFLGRAGAVAALAVVAAAGGRYLAERTRIMLARRDEVVLPAAVEVVGPADAASDLAVEGITPIIVSNEDFYRIDTAPLTVPQVDLATWTLHLKGRVGREVSLTYQDILDMPMVERYITISCVSNDVGGGLVGNARWLGVPLKDVVDLAGVGDGAEQLVARSVDDFTVGFPIDAVYDGREALLAVGMNGEPLPFEHGFPARLVVSGLYGYVSATKWLQDIELTTWDGFDAYWIPRGWAKEAPIKTQSRIDTPVGTAAAGPRAIAGVAWAPGRGISRVEVRIDEGDWVEAELSDPLSKDAWIQWNLAWDPAPGTYVIQVRATDGDGQTQTEAVAPPAPDGATGYHSVRVSVA